MLVIAEEEPGLKEVQGILKDEMQRVSLLAGATVDGAIEALNQAKLDAIILDESFSEGTGLMYVKTAREFQPGVPIIILGDRLDKDNIGALMRSGATDFILRDELFRLPALLQDVLAEPKFVHGPGATWGIGGAAEARFRAIFDTIGIGIALVLPDGRILESNFALQQMFGYSADELRSLTQKDISHSQDDAQEKAQYQRLLKGECAFFQVEKRFVRKDGRIIWGRLTVTLGGADSGAPRFSVLMIEDITERQEVEQANLQYASIMESSNDAITNETFDGTILSWNAAAERLFGYPASEANGRSITMILPPGRMEGEYWRIVDRIRSGERVDNFETVRVRKEGTRVFVSMTVSPIFDVAGKIVAICTVSRDITERKRIENLSANFARLGERLSSATASVEAARIIVDAADRLLGWDACKLVLCSTDHQKMTEVLTMDVINGQRTDFSFSGEDSAVSPVMKSVLMDGAKLILREAPVQAPPEFIPFGDRSRPSASLMYAPVRNGPSVIGVLTIQSYQLNAYSQRDLETLQSLADHCGGALERIRAETENQKLAAFAQFNPNPVLELSNEGKVTYSNEAARHLAEAVGVKDPIELLPAQIPALVRECLASGKEKLRIEKSLGKRTFSWSFFPIPFIGVVHSYGGDITDRHNLEEQLRQSQKMESIGQLAGGVAHDFNNILTVIQGHASLMSMNSTLTKAGKESVEQIKMASSRAANLTRQLLTFSRRQVLQPVNLDLNEVVRNMTKMLTRLLGEQINLIVNCAPDLPVITADQGMMEQVLMNLTVNARDAMPHGGDITIETSVFVVGPAYVLMVPEAHPGVHVCMTVKDTGKGIPAEILPRIFEPFFTTKDVGKGTGLGLATVYGILQQHHGFVRVNSTVNQGSVFQIFLPAAKGKSGELLDKKKQAEDLRGGNETILVVEDEAPLRMLVKCVLEKYGYTVYDAPSGRAALSVWEEHKKDIKLVVTDMVMPEGVGGRELAESLVVKNPELKFVFCSGYSLDVIGTSMVLEEGMNFLQKPYAPDRLIRTVRSVLDKKPVA